MKKIKFGSFPLVNMTKKDRNCIDKYSIKSYADLITLNSAVRSNDKLMDRYITPYSVYKYFKQYEDNETTPDEVDRRNTMKRAFKSLKDISSGIQNIPFYSDKVAFPIYLEHQAPGKVNNDYDFLLLTNDLVDKQVLDEIVYDDTITMLFLVIKDQFYPRIALPMMGRAATAPSDTIRKEFAQFIEHCHRHSINPLDVFLNIIKYASYNKFKGAQSDFITGMKAHVASALGAKASALFQNGEIKSADFFIKSLDQGTIADFMDPDQKRNADAHVFNPTAQRMINDGTVSQNDINELQTQRRTDPLQSSRLTREYLLSKTHHFNQVLSVVDALLYFNKQDEIISDVSDGSLTHAVTFNDGSSMSINADKIVDRLRNVYFDAFVKNLITIVNSQYIVFEGEAIQNISDYTVRNQLKALRTRASDLNNRPDEKKEITLIEKIIDDNIYQMSLLDPNDPMRQTYQSDIDNRYNQINAIRKQISLNQIANIGQKSDNSKQMVVKYKFEENIDAIQGSLTFLLNEIESIIYDQVRFNDMLNKYKLNDVDSRAEFLTTFESTFATIVSEVLTSFKTVYVQELIRLYELNGMVFDMNTQSAIDEMNPLNVGKLINDKLRISTNQMFKEIYRDFGSSVSQKTYEYAAHRVETNPIIKKTIQQKNNFKTFVISDKVLLDLYEMLHYIDSQKYLAGLLAYPPSKIMGDLARMKYIITRLGLNHNPVFIYHIKDGSILLSAPDVLSLTGTPVFNKITHQQMEAICKLDFRTSLWNDSNIMAKVKDENESKQDFKILNKTISDLRNRINKLSNNKKRNPAQNRELIRARGLLIKAEESLVAAQNNKLQDKFKPTVQFSTGLPTDFNPDFGQNAFQNNIHGNGYQQPISSSQQPYNQGRDYQPRPPYQQPRPDYNQGNGYQQPRRDYQNGQGNGYQQPQQIPYQQQYTPHTQQGSSYKDQMRENIMSRILNQNNQRRY